MDLNPSGRQKLTLSRNQILLGWGVISLLLVGVFLFGLYSGRQQGVELALIEQSTPRLRLPVEEPRGRGLLAKPEGESVVPNSQEKFDFSSTNDSFVVPENAQKSGLAPADKLAEKLTEVKIDPSSGFVSKAANEITTQKEEPITQAVPEVKESLAERVAKVELSGALQQTGGTTIEKPIVEAPVKLASKDIKNEVKVTKPIPDEKPIKAAIEKITPPAKTIKATPKMPSGLFVQVAAPDSFSKAQALVSKLRAKGITAAVRDASVNRQVHYRVLIGPFSNRESAQGAKVKVMKSGVAAGEPFIKNY